MQKPTPIVSRFLQLTVMQSINISGHGQRQIF
jgi:hypothetical protein